MKHLVVDGNKRVQRKKIDMNYQKSLAFTTSDFYFDRSVLLTKLRGYVLIDY
jgi:hypothetical protein